MSNHTGKFKKATAVTLSSLVLGSMLATAPAITASPDSPFGAIDSAYAATGNMVDPAKVTVTPISEDGRTSNISLDYIGVTLKAGDYFQVNNLNSDIQTMVNLDNIYVDENYTYNGNGNTFSLGTIAQGDLQFSERVPQSDREYISSLLVGKTIQHSLKRWPTRSLPTEIKLQDGTVIATRPATGPATDRFTFTDAVEGRANIQFSFDFIAGNNTGDYRDTYVINPDGTKFDTTPITDRLKQTADSINYWTRVDILNHDTMNPVSIYINGDKVSTREVGPSTPVHYRANLRLDGMNGRNEFGRISDASITDGNMSLSTVGHKNIVAGKRVTTTVQLDADTMKYFTFKNLDDTRAYNLTKNFSVSEQVNIGTPDNPRIVDATREEYNALMNNDPAFTLNLDGKERDFADGSNYWFKPSEHDKYDFRIDSVNPATGTLIYSWTPVVDYEALNLSVPINITQEGIKKQAGTNKFTGTGARNGTQWTITSVQDGAEVGKGTAGGGWFFTGSEASAAFTPTAAPDESTTKFSTPVTKKLTDNDNFPDGTWVSTTITKQPANGKLEPAGDGTFKYTPNPGFAGVDTVEYKNLDSNNLESNVTTWTINVTPPAPPTGQGESDTIQAGETATRDLKANDSFPESPYKSTTITANPANGTVVRNADGTYTYTPKAGWVGTDTVTYTQTDQFGNTTEPLVWTINVLAPAAPDAKSDTIDLAFDANGTVDLIKNDSAKGLNNSINKGTATFTDGSKSQTIDGVTFTINDQGVLSVDSKGSNNAGVYELAYTVRDAYGTPSQAGILVTIAEPTAQVSLKTLIAGEDANDSANPVVLAPGEQEVTFEVTNPNTYALNSSNFTIELKDGTKVTLEDGFTIAPGATGTVTGKVVLPKQGTASVEATAKVAYNYTLNGTAKTVSANSEDPAYVKAETGTISLAEDTSRVRVGESVTVDPLTNDEASSGLDRSTLTYQFDPTIWTEGEDGTYTSEFGTVSVDEESNLVYQGTAEGKLEGVTYTVKSNLGDEHEPVSVSVEVFDYHIELKALVGKDKLDANDKESAYEEVITDEDVNEVEVPVTLTYTNPSETDSVTVTHFTDNLGNTYTLEEPKVLAPGESFSFEGTQVFGVGEHEVVFTVHTTEGVEATDPIFVNIAKEIVPNEAPTHSVPEMPIPTPEPTPVMEKPKPFTPDTGSGLLVNGKKVEVKPSNTGLVAGTIALLASMGTAFGLVHRRNRRA